MSVVLAPVTVETTQSPADSCTETVFNVDSDWINQYTSKTDISLIWLGVLKELYDQGYSKPFSIGTGGMAQVFCSVSPKTGERVAFKFPKQRGSRSVRERFQHEALISEFLDDGVCDQILNIYRTGTIGRILPVPFIEMEFFRRSPHGVNCHNWSIEEAIENTILPVCHALEYAHFHDIVHRDVKPANILVAPFGDSVKLTDFGLALDLRAVRTSTDPLARHGVEVVGTPAYMAPEQIRNPGAVDYRADVYGVGATLYKLITDRPPYYRYTTPVALLEAVRNPLFFPTPPDFVNPQADLKICDIVVKAMSPDPDKRYQTVWELRTELERYLSYKANEEAVAEAIANN